MHNHLNLIKIRFCVRVDWGFQGGDKGEALLARREIVMGSLK